MRKVIVTDLTRFANQKLVCTAMIDIESGECIRPMPYFSSQACAKYNIQPGAIFTGNFTFNDNAEKPHVEDATYSNLRFHGPSSSNDFRNILINSLSQSVSNGFNYVFDNNQKHIPIADKVDISIITIAVDPSNILIHEDKYKPGKIKLSFTDKIGHSFSYLSITDRGFHDYAMSHQHDGTLELVQNFISRQNEVYLRLGLSRAFQISDRNGYWLQVNGIYTFPDFNREIRSYM